jgi:hypothetical protein
MGDYRLVPALTLVVGMTGSGKSTFAYRHLINCPAACRFLFDDLGRAASRLEVRPCYTPAELEAAIPSRWVVFNPHRAFPGDTKAAVRFFCKWTFEASKRGPGKKLLLIDEVWQWQDREGIPKELALCVQAGREEGLELVTCTQQPEDVHPAITGQSTELVAFRLADPSSLRRVRQLGIEEQDVSVLQPGSFIALNRLSGGRLSGEVF